MAESYFNHGRGSRKKEERTEMKEENLTRMREVGSVGVRRRSSPLEARPTRRNRREMK